VKLLLTSDFHVFILQITLNVKVTTMKTIITAAVIAGISTTASQAALPRADMRHVLAGVEMKHFRYVNETFEPDVLWWLYIEHEQGPAAFQGEADK